MPACFMEKLAPAALSVLLHSKLKQIMKRPLLQLRAEKPFHNAVAEQKLIALLVLHIDRAPGIVEDRLQRSVRTGQRIFLDTPHHNAVHHFDRIVDKLDIIHFPGTCHAALVKACIHTDSVTDHDRNDHRCLDMNLFQECFLLTQKFGVRGEHDQLIFP